MSTKKKEESFENDDDDESLQVPLQLKLEVNRSGKRRFAEEREFSLSTR